MILFSNLATPTFHFPVIYNILGSKEISVSRRKGKREKKRMKISNLDTFCKNQCRNQDSLWNTYSLIRSSENAKGDRNLRWKKEEEGRGWEKKREKREKQNKRG